MTISRRAAAFHLTSICIAAGRSHATGARRLRYGGDRDFAPFESLDAAGRPQGFQPELLRALAQQAGFALEIDLRDWPDVEQGLRDGRYDTIAMVDTPERRAWALFLPSHATPSLALYLPRERAEPQSIGALTGWRVADIDSAPMRATRPLLQAAAALQFVKSADWPSALDAVRNGQADAALIPRAYGDALLRNPAYAGLKSAALSLNLQPYAFAVAPGNPALRDELAAALAALESDGRLEALRQRWLSSHRQAAQSASLLAELARHQRWLIGGAVLATTAVAGLLLLARQRSARVRLETNRRRAAEATLAEAQARLDHAFMRHPDAMLVISLDDGRVLDVNQTLCALLELPRDAIVGRRPRELPGLADNVNLPALAAMVARDGGFDAIPLQITRPGGGAVRHCLASCERMPTQAGDRLFALLRDVTQAMQADRALREGYDELVHRVAALDSELLQASRQRERAEASARSFTAAITGELRSPIQAVRGMAGLVQRALSHGQLEDAQRGAAMIDRSASRMERLLAALARLAQVDQHPLQRGTVPMREYAASALKSVAAAYPSHPVQARIADGLPPADADPSLMLRVWRDLIDNACKFIAGRPDPRVQIDSFEEAGRRWYRVADNGVGIDPGRADRLFLPFQRLHGAAEFDGLGIGLVLVQRIVRRHGGEVRVHSQPGVGTSVEFSLEEPVAAGA